MKYLNYPKFKQAVINSLLFIAVLLAWGSGFITGIQPCFDAIPVSNKCDSIQFMQKKYSDTTHLSLATTYNATTGQCDSSPEYTADGSYIDPIKLKNKEIRWVALSRDLIWDDYRQTIFKDTTHWRGTWKFGDTIEVYSNEFPHLNGEWVVHDCKAASHSNSIDFLMDPENNTPKLGLGRDVKIITCGSDNSNFKNE